MTRRFIVVPAIAAFLALSVWFSAARAGEWPGWRGPTGQGTADEKDPR